MTVFPQHLDNLDPGFEASKITDKSVTFDAIDALQRKVGVDGSADTSSLDYKVSHGGGGGGGGGIHTHQAFSMFTQAFSSGDLVSLGGTISGDTLFDLTNPAHAVVLSEGMYSVIGQGGPDSGAIPGKTQKLQLLANFLTDPVGSVSVYETTPLDFAGIGGPVGWVSLTWYMEAGDDFSLTVFHDIGTATVFDINLFAQRLS